MDGNQDETWQYVAGVDHRPPDTARIMTSVGPSQKLKLTEEEVTEVRKDFVKS